MAIKMSQTGAIRRESHGRKKSKKASPKRMQRPQPLPDTNALYPPDLEYAQANYEMRSPTKKRPLSGGPSPDRYKLQIPKQNDDEFQELQAKIFNEHRETQINLLKMKQSIAATRQDLKEKIELGNKTISQYKAII